MTQTKKCNRGYTFNPQQIEALGDSALMVRFGQKIDPGINELANQLADEIITGQWNGITTIVPGYASLAIHYDPEFWSFDSLKKKILKGKLIRGGNISRQGKLVEIPVVYGGEDGPDLLEISRALALTPEEIIQRHAERLYRVYFIGFQPGFPYLGGMDPSIAVPRLKIPRTSVPAGSVGIAGEQTGIYPQDSPGGWRIIGRTQLRLFYVDHDPPALLSAGDSVRFVPLIESKVR